MQGKKLQDGPRKPLSSVQGNELRDRFGNIVALINPVGRELLLAMFAWKDRGVHLLDTFPPSWKDLEASWRKMTLTNPPMNIVFYTSPSVIGPCDTEQWPLCMLVEGMERTYDIKQHPRNRASSYIYLEWSRSIQVGNDLERP